MTSSLIPDVDLVPSVASRVVRVKATDMQEGSVAEGETVTFGLPYPLRVPADGLFIKPGSETVTLDNNGIADIRLPCYDPDAIRVDGSGDWLITVKPSWGCEYGIRVPVGTTRIDLASLEPVRQLTAREKVWAITGATVRVTTGSTADGSVSLSGGVLDIDLTIPSGEWKRGAADGGALDDLVDGVHTIHSAPAAIELGLPRIFIGELEKVSIDSNSLTAVAHWTPRTNPPETWTTVRYIDGWGSWSRTDNREPTPAAFGAVGDGVEDDTQALRNWFAYLAANSTSGLLDPVTYRVTDTVGIANPANPFHVRGSDAGQSFIVLDADTPKPVVSIQGARQSTFTNFYVGGVASNRLCGDGVILADPQHCTVSGVRVGYYSGYAVRYFRATTGVVCENNRIADCIAVGGGNARDGFRIDHGRKSYITNCTVMALSLSGDAGQGLSLGEDSIDCQINGGHVNSAPVGVGLGATGGLSHRNQVTGVAVVSCKWGVTATNSAESRVQMLVNQRGSESGGHPAQVGEDCSNVHLDLSLQRLPTGAPVVYFQSSGNSALIAPIQNPPNPLIRIGQGVGNTTVVYEGRHTDATVLDQSGVTSNSVIGLVGLATDDGADALAAYLAEIGA